MKDDLLVSVARKYNLSKSTVSKAARHCSGVDSETRELILDELKAMNRTSAGHADIYCILPDTPKYFWHEVRRGIEENHSADISMKLNIYTKIRDESAILTYLTEAEQIKPHVIIISAVLSDAISEKLETMMKDTFVLILSEFDNIKNSFYYGADPYDDGYRFGRMCRIKYPMDRTVVLTLAGDRNSELRAKGFTDALEKAKQSFIPITFTVALQQKNAASILAKMLSPYRYTADGIYSSVGSPSLPLAVKKAGFPDNTVILAHDTFSSAGISVPPEGFHAVINQDVYSQGKAAIEAAEFFVRTMRYPYCKRIHIPSVILNNL